MIEDKLKRFQETLQEHKNVLFCVCCGSTNVGQDSLHALRCHDCGNALEWDGLSFGLVQMRCPPKAMLKETKEAFILRGKTPPWVRAVEAKGFTKS
ncbi:hypothetical protein MYX84_05175 [Acidobacteria bacterium AH-259-O06]|nr:hypothetical protein [Acidobacteria bacterium AH-259-O06]